MMKPGVLKPDERVYILLFSYLGQILKTIKFPEL